MRAIDQQLLERTLRIRQPYAARELSDEDARQIVEHVTGFFNVLLGWEAAERDSDSQPSDSELPPSPAIAKGRR